MISNCSSSLSQDLPCCPPILKAKISKNNSCNGDFSKKPKNLETSKKHLISNQKKTNKKNNLDKVKKSLKFEEREFQKLKLDETDDQTQDENGESNMDEEKENESALRNAARIEEEHQQTSSLPKQEKHHKNYSLQMLESFLVKEEKFSPSNFLQNHPITPNMRTRMIDWFIEVLTSYQCCNETFFLCISLMDRFFQMSKKSQEAKDLHLIGVTSIFIACKFEELYPLKLQIVHERIAHRKLSCEEIKSKEMEILDDLDFEMMGPTFYDFVILLLHLIDVQSQVNEQKYDLFVSIVSYVSKLVVFDYDIISNKKISLIAAGVLYVSFKIMEQLDKSFNLVANMGKIKQLLKMEDNVLIEIATQILFLAKNFENLFQNLGNLKKYHSNLFEQLQKIQKENQERMAKEKKMSPMMED